jgi:Tfp pilus assembly protein PilO
MAKTSKIFYGLVGVLLILIAGLIYAIVQQRQSTYRTHLKEQLDLDGRRIEVISEKARVVTRQIPMLKERLASLQQRWQQVQGRMYRPEDSAEIEGILKQIAGNAQLEFVGLEPGSVEDTGNFREHVLNIRMSGNQTNLPAWADAFFKQRRLAKLDRISVISPDLQFQKFKLKATVRYFEPKDPAQLVPGQIPLERFDVPLNYLTNSEDASDPVYGKSLEQTKQKATELNGLKTELDEAGKLEKQIAVLEKLLAAERALEDQLRSNRNTALQNLPTLYIRVRNSPVGSAALLLTGNDVKFPELAGDE